MKNKIIKHIVLFVLFVIFVSFITFFLLDVSPIDPISAYERTHSISLTESARDKLISDMNLDKPLITRYFEWFGKFLKLDLGVSTIFRRPVIDMLIEGMEASIALMFFAWVLQGVTGIFLGIVSGSNVGSIKDRIIKAFAIIFSATPTFWVGILLIIVFSLKLGWFPTSMGTPIGIVEKEVSVFQKIHHMILPCLSLVIVGVSNLILQTRTKVEDVLNSDYVLYAKMQGISKKTIISKYVLRNMIIPGLVLHFTYFSELISGTLFVENVFNYPGLGNLTVQAGLRGDAPLLIGSVLFSSLLVYFGNRMCDVIVYVLDPRIRRNYDGR